MMRFTGMLTGILITTGLYFLYLNLNMQASPNSGMKQVLENSAVSPEQTTIPLTQVPAQAPETAIVDKQPLLSKPPEPEIISEPTSASATFWKPFRSHYSAAGFARRMSRATGIEIKVIEADKHLYKVAFNYSDEHERAAKTSLIENVTGLDLGGGNTP